MTPEEFEKMVKDYSENGLPEGSALICLHGGMITNFGLIYGRSRELTATLALMMSKDKDFARMIMTAYGICTLAGDQEKAEAAKTVSDYLDRMGFKKES